MGKIILRLDRVMLERKRSKIKNNKVTAIRFSTLEKICAILECSPGDIIKNQNDK